MREAAAASMKVPDLLARPEMVFGNELLQALLRRNRRAGTGLSIESVCAAEL